MQGRFCRLEPLDPQLHLADLCAAWADPEDEKDWTYMPFGPFRNEGEFRRHLDATGGSSDALHYTVIDLTTDRAVGTLALMRIEPGHGVIEVGFVTFSRYLKRSPLSTEAQFLLMKYVFDQLGYRRYEWKCDSLNAPSCNAARRLGFSFEGTFRQAIVYKGRNRDTNWFSIIDKEWPSVREAFEQWLKPENFDEDGKQRHSLAALRDNVTK